MRDNINEIYDCYNIDYRHEREPALKFNTMWVQDADNQKQYSNIFTAILQKINRSALHMQSKFLLWKIPGVL